jgi:hypothetical protein
MENIAPPLNEAQIKLWTIINQNPIDESDLNAIQRLLMQYYAEKAMDLADKAWDEKGLSDDLAFQHFRRKSNGD